MTAGQLRKHERFRSRFLRNQRDFIVYLPPGYDDQPFTRFPVLYLQDGQNLFDRATAFAGQDWNVQGAANQLIAAGSVEPLIIVGIYNTGKSRINEYTPTKAPKLGGGRADRYSKFLFEEVMPFVRREYRIANDPRATGIGGSSLGGLLSLYLGLKHPHIFGKIAALSPSVWWHQRMITQFASTWPSGVSTPDATQTGRRRTRSAGRGSYDVDMGAPPFYPEPRRAVFEGRSSAGADFLKQRPGASEPSALGAPRSVSEGGAPTGIKQFPRATIWLDIGTKEGPRIVPDVEQFRDVLLKTGWRLGEDLHYERVEGGEHNELAWSHRIGRVLQFLYPASLSL